VGRRRALLECRPGHGNAAGAPPAFRERGSKRKVGFEYEPGALLLFGRLNEPRGAEPDGLSAIPPQAQRQALMGESGATALIRPIRCSRLPEHVADGCCLWHPGLVHRWVGGGNYLPRPLKFGRRHGDCATGDYVGMLAQVIERDHRLQMH